MNRRKSHVELVSHTTLRLPSIHPIVKVNFT